MITILVAYSDTKLSKKAAQTVKRYAFNTELDLKVDDRFTSDDYSTAMQVVEVLPEPYNYINLATGELSVERTKAVNCVALRELAEESSDTIYIQREA